MRTFKRHPLRWFSNRVGKIVKSLSFDGSVLTVYQIASPAHAKALHDFHVTKRINFEDYGQ